MNKLSTIAGLALLVACSSASGGNLLPFLLPAPAAAQSNVIYDVIMTAGQSNMRGFTDGNTNNIPWVTSGTAYYWGGIDPENTGVAPQLTMIDPNTRTNHVLGYSPRGNSYNAFAVTWINQTGHRLVIVDTAKGGTSIDVDWNPTNSGSLATNAIAQFRQATNWMITNGWTYNFKGIIWNQGENNATILGTTTAQNTNDFTFYRTAMTNLFTYFSTNVPSNGDVPVYVQRTATVAFPGGSTSSPEGQYIGINTICADVVEDFYSWQSLRDAQTTFCQSSPLARMVYWSSLLYTRTNQIPNFGAGNNVHWSQLGYNWAGTNTALEILNKGSTFVQETAPTNLLFLTNYMSVGLVWSNTGNCYWHRIFRADHGANNWTLMGRLTNGFAISYRDESALVPGNTYDYTVSSQNEFSEAFAVTNSITVPSAITNFSAFASFTGASSTTTTNMWNIVATNGVTNNLFAFITPGVNVSAGTIFDAVNTNRTVNITSAANLVGRALNFIGASSTATFSCGTNLTPLNGPFTLAMVLTNSNPTNFAYLWSSDGSGQTLAIRDSGNVGAPGAMQIDRNFQATTTGNATNQSGAEVVTFIYDGTEFSLYDSKTNGVVANTVGFPFGQKSHIYFQHPKGNDAIGQAVGGTRVPTQIAGVAVWNTNMIAQLGSIQNALTNAFWTP